MCYNHTVGIGFTVMFIIAILRKGAFTMKKTAYKTSISDKANNYNDTGKRVYTDDLGNYYIKNGSRYDCINDTPAEKKMLTDDEIYALKKERAELSQKYSLTDDSAENKAKAERMKEIREILGYFPPSRHGKGWMSRDARTVKWD